jgi:hypothetical protein
MYRGRSLIMIYIHFIETLWKGGVNPYTFPKSIFYFYLENNIALFLGVFDSVKGCLFK